VPKKYEFEPRTTIIDSDFLLPVATYKDNPILVQRSVSNDQILNNLYA